MNDSVRSGDGLMTFGARDLLIRSWNEEAERLTGISARDAVGRHCWDVLRGVDGTGALVCHAGCSGARMAAEGRPAPSHELHAGGPAGRVALTVATLVADTGGDQLLCMHVLREAARGTGSRLDDSYVLSPRQREVLALLAEGVNAKTIARRLCISELTARNHVRAIRLRLGCHSQLEAVAEARRRGLV